MTAGVQRPHGSRSSTPNGASAWTRPSSSATRTDSRSKRTGSSRRSCRPRPAEVDRPAAGIVGLPSRSAHRRAAGTRMVGSLLDLADRMRPQDRRRASNSAPAPASPSVRAATVARRVALAPPRTRASRRPQRRRGSPGRRNRSDRTAATVSPPAITVVADVAATASAIVRVPAANCGSSNRPIGPFQNTVPAPAMRSAYRAAVFAPMSSPIQPSGTSTPLSAARDRFIVLPPPGEQQIARKGESVTGPV